VGAEVRSAPRHGFDLASNVVRLATAGRPKGGRRMAKKKDKKKKGKKKK